MLLIVIICVPTVADVTSALNKTSGEPGYGAGYSVQQTSDGGYIITGTKYSDEPKLLSQMIWLIKTAPNGDQVWNRIFGGSHNDVGYSVQQTSDGYIIAGSTESFGAGGLDLWLIKTDVSGNEVWNRTFGGLRGDWGRSIQQTNDGGYVVTGSTYSYDAAHQSQMVWLIKTDANGDKVWDRIFGGPSDDWGNCVQQTRDGGYIITGSKVPVARITGEIWVIKTDANGTEVWDKSFGGSDDDVGKSVQQTSDGGYIITGSKTSPSGGSQSVWLIKIDPNGNEAWDRTFGESGWNEGKSVEQTSDDGYIITGSTYPYGVGGKNSAIWLIKTDRDGNKVWDKTIS